jgi:hypothetical protein
LMCHRYPTANRVTIAPRAGTDRAKSAHAAFAVRLCSGKHSSNAERKLS